MNVDLTLSGVGTMSSAKDSFESTLYSSIVDIQPTHFDRSLKNIHPGVTIVLDGDNKFSAPDRYRRGRTIHPIWVGFSCEVMDLNPHTADRDLKKFAY